MMKDLNTRLRSELLGNGRELTIGHDSVDLAGVETAIDLHGTYASKLYEVCSRFTKAARKTGERTRKAGPAPMSA